MPPNSIESDAPTGEVRQRAVHLGPVRRRPLVLDAALRVFAEHGYRGTSMQAIASEAGVTKPVVYECFASKDALLEALLAREEQRLLASVLAALPQQPRFDKLESLLADGLIGFLTAACERPDSWRVVFAAEHGRDTVVSRRVQRARRAIVDQLRALTTQFLALDAEQDAREADLLAELLASIAESAGRMLVVDKQPWAPVELGNYLAKLLTRGVLNRR